MEQLALLFGTLFLIIGGILTFAVITTILIQCGAAAIYYFYLLFLRTRSKIKKLGKKKKDILTPEDLGCKVVSQDKIHLHGGYTYKEVIMMAHVRNAKDIKEIQKLARLGNPFAEKKLQELEKESKKKQQPLNID